ncbi:MAG: transposase [Terracidiphilus sp.]
MRPGREVFRNRSAAYFVTAQTAERRPFFRHERWAELLRETLLHYAEKGYLLHAYVIMPDHFHALIVPDSTLEKSMQLIKGGYSFRAKKAFDWKFEIWQQGFSDHRIRDEEDWKRHLAYIRGNPVEAGLVEDGEVYPYMDFPGSEFPQGLKPLAEGGVADVRAEARTLHAEARTLQTKVSGAGDEQAKARTLNSIERRFGR